MTVPGVIFASALWNWIHRLGGPGLILLGLADNSVVPLPGSVDALTIILSAHRKGWWWYYAVMATVGAVVGGYLTFRLGAKGGEEAREKEKVPRRRAKKVYSIFNKYGFWAVVVPALLPPPVPIVPFLLTAGALKYSRRRFIAALTLGRGIRYTIEAYLGRIYGAWILRVAGQYYRPLLITLIGLGVAAGIVALYYYRKKKREGAAKSKPPSRHAA